MSRLVVGAALLAWMGLALLFAGIPFFHGSNLADRLRAYTPGAPRRGSGLRTAQSFREIFGPLAGQVGGHLATVFGVQEELRIRLERVHGPEDATEFRMRQVASAFGALIVSATLLTAIGLAPLVTLALAWVAPLLTFLVFEQHLGTRSATWQRDLEIDAPLLAEQLAMLLDAGMSLGSSLQRIAQRSDGAVAHDLRRVTRRIRQGVSESDALDEWRAVAGVPAIDRLVAVLRFHTETSELGRLVSDEARISREESHRRLLEAMERKAQAVWIPVTVAALVPGVIFLSVPFLRALSFFSSS